MVNGGIPIGRAFGIPLRLHYSWFFIFGLVTWALATNYFPTTFPTWSTTTSIIAGIITSLLFFGSVMAHELMHSRVAQAEGLKVDSIVLFALGGVSQIAGEPATAKDEFRIAFAGPMTSIVLGLIFGIIYFAVRGTNQFLSGISYWLGLINVALGVMNLVPGFPLDGGRVFRSLIWWRTGNLKKSTLIASNVGRGFGYLFIFGGIYLIFTGNVFNGIWIALIGWYLESAAVGSYRQTLLQDVLKSHIATDIMTRECQSVTPDLTIEKLMNENVMKSGRRCFPVTTDSHIEGLVTLDNLRKVPQERWSTTTVREVMTTLDNLKSVQPGDDLFSVLKIMTESDINQVPVVYNRDIVGMIGRDNLLSFINTQSATRT